ncbi:MAG: hypothetical protein CR986_02470 [Ignavibacteriae bacterium]|nr:MAG: hypothetical protein CR986_02470 [Ignavibacteriota bacterium]
MKKKTIWILGSIAFILICLCCMFFKIQTIEEDLRNRTRNALNEAGIKVENLIIDGRAVTLSGIVKSENIKQKAGNITENIWGVNSVSNNLIIKKSETPTPAKQQIIQNKLDQIIGLENIQFETAKEIIKPISYPILNKVVTILKENPNLAININGHTDSTGEPEFNNMLSKKRAESVKNYLVSKGISQNRLVTNGYGSSQPIVDNKTKESRKKNRRVEFKIIKEN